MPFLNPSICFRRRRSSIALEKKEASKSCQASNRRPSFSTNAQKLLAFHPPLARLSVKNGFAPSTRTWMRTGSGVFGASYMEVAMNTSLYSALIASSLLLGLAGCADQLTDSRGARIEGTRLLADKDYSHAVGAFRNAVKQEPRDYRSHYYLGVCYEELGQYQQAMQSYRTALTVPQGPDEDGTPADFRPQMLDAYAKAIAAHDSRDAELNLLEARAKTEGKTENYMVIARIYRYRHDPDSAIHAYKQALVYGPHDFSVYKEYGIYLLDNLQQEKDAEVPLRRAYTLNANDEQVNAALRRIGIVPGPGLKDQNQLATPLIPRGPIPEVDLKKLFNGNSSTPTNTNTNVVTPPANPTPAPRD